MTLSFVRLGCLLFINLEKIGFCIIWVPQSFFINNLGSAKLFEVILGSATSKRLKNTALNDYVIQNLCLSQPDFACNGIRFVVLDPLLFGIVGWIEGSKNDGAVHLKTFNLKFDWYSLSAKMNGLEMHFITLRIKAILR
jgi:hypothetical protein